MDAMAKGAYNPTLYRQKWGGNMVVCLQRDLLRAMLAAEGELPSHYTTHLIVIKENKFVMVSVGCDDGGHGGGRLGSWSGLGRSEWLRRRVIDLQTDFSPTPSPPVEG